MKSVVGERGQITIPKRLRDRLGIEQGQVLEFEERRGAILLRKTRAPESPFQKLVGVIKEKTDVDRYLEETRGPAWNKKLDPEKLK